MKRVITYGTFDLLHYGHINLLKRAKALGDYLVVVLSTDEFNWNSKHKKCYFNYEVRKQLLEAIRYVDLVNRSNQTTMLNFPRYLHISLLDMDCFYQCVNYSQFIIHADFIPLIHVSTNCADIFPVV